MDIGSIIDKIKVNWRLFVSGLMFLALLFKPNVIGIIIPIFLFCIITIFSYKADSTQYRSMLLNKRIISLLFASLFLIVSFFSFINTWKNSRVVNSIFTRLGLNTYGAVVFISFILSVLSLYVLYMLLLHASVKISNRENVFKIDNSCSDIKCVDYKSVIFIFIIAFVTITLCSMSSFIYPFNTWVDSNCFFTVGRSMSDGLTLYKDIYEQKGPLLYVIHMLASYVSRDTFFGVYLFEVLACFFTMFFMYKIIMLFCKKESIILLPILSALIYTLSCFKFGDSAEEFCLPFISYGLYIGCKSVVKDKIISSAEFFLIGITASCVMLIKFTMLGFYFGWIVVPAYMIIKSGKWFNLVKSLLYIVLGVIVVSLPFVIYFAINGAITDFICGYFYNNMFLYGGHYKENILFNICNNIRVAIKRNFALFTLIISSLFTVLHFSKKMVAFVFTTFLGLCFFVYFSIAFSYYTFIFTVYSVFSVVFIYYCFSNKITCQKLLKYKKMLCSTSLVICLGLCLYVSPNAGMIFYDRESLPQYYFKNIIGKFENPTLLNYGFLDGGFYTVCNIVPTYKYFCKLNMKLPEMIFMQDEVVKSGKVDFVVTQNRELKDEDLYKCVAVSAYRDHLEGLKTYRLYQLKSLK